MAERCVKIFCKVVEDTAANTNAVEGDVEVGVVNQAGIGNEDDDDGFEEVDFANDLGGGSLNVEVGSMAQFNGVDADLGEELNEEPIDDGLLEREINVFHETPAVFLGVNV